MTHVPRRSAIRASALALAGSVAGCGSLLGEQPSTPHEPELEVLVVNATDATIAVTVVAYRGDESVFEHTYHLGPGKADESEAVPEVPTAVEVDVRDGVRVQTDYSVPATCESPEVNVTVSPEEVDVDNGCVRP